MDKLKSRVLFYSIVANITLLLLTAGTCYLWLTCDCPGYDSNQITQIRIDTIYPSNTTLARVTLGVPKIYKSRLAISDEKVMNDPERNPNLNAASPCDSIIYYSDTIDQPDNFKAVINDTLRNNKIFGRSVWWVNLKPMVRETIEVHAKEKPRLYLGGVLLLPAKDIKTWGVGPMAQLSIPKVGLVGYSYDLINNRHAVSFAALIKIPAKAR